MVKNSQKRANVIKVWPLTLSQSGREDFATRITSPSPRIFRPSYGPVHKKNQWDDNYVQDAPHLAFANNGLVCSSPVLIFLQSNRIPRQQKLGKNSPASPTEID